MAKKTIEQTAREVALMVSEDFVEENSDAIASMLRTLCNDIASMLDERAKSLEGVSVEDASVPLRHAADAVRKLGGS